MKLDAGLYLIATPIGTARDITLRALDVLAEVDVLAAEDTRTARKLLEIHGIALAGRRMIAYHDHSGSAARAAILAQLAQGKSVAYLSEAGSPLIADPGYVLVNEVRAAGYAVTALPGPSAVITAMMLAGLPTDRFLFAGFAPSQAGARRKFFEEFVPCPATLVFFESPKRIVRCLDAMTEAFGGERKAAICRELTKKFEEVRRGTLSELRQSVEDAPPKGEIVIVVERGQGVARQGDMEAMLLEALKELRTRDAADLVASELGLPRRQVYQAALALVARGGN